MTKPTELENKLITRKTFSAQVEMKAAYPDVTYLDAILEVCEEHDLDPADCNRYLSSILKKKLEVEAINARLVKGSHDTLSFE